MKRLLFALVASMHLQCTATPTPAFVHQSLIPVRPLFVQGDPLWTPQPHRERPLRIAVAPDGRTAWVTLQGIEETPGRHVAVIDVATRSVRARVEVGSSPTGVAVHPSGRFVAVTNRFSNWTSILDATTDRVVAEIPTDYYATDLSFTPDGLRAYVSNRWKNHVTRWNVQIDGERFRVSDNRAATLAASTHPRDVAINTDGTRLAVAGLDGLQVHLYELPSERLVRTINLRAPVNDVLFADHWLVALTQGAGSGHPPLVGPDTDEDGRPGDSTANNNFQDQQNEIAVLRSDNGNAHQRYTSANICCREYRDVSPDDPLLGSFLPPRETWIVHGTVPEASAWCTTPNGPRLYVVYLSSRELETFALDSSSGTLTSLRVSPTGLGPTSIACAPGGVLVVGSLAERVFFHDTEGTQQWTVAVGDLSAGEFPATDAEIGEAVNIATAPFTVDGAQSCLQCHREFGSPDKAFSMPLQRFPEGIRNTLAHRGLADTRPWFFEAAMDENNFFPVLNEFARVENFCCTDPSLFPRERPAPADCESNPPPVCAQRPWPRNFSTRNRFYLHQANETFGRSTTFGDAFEAPLNFQGLTSALGLSLLHRSRLLPNPNPNNSPAALRGRALFEASSTGCLPCHSGPGFAASVNSGTRVHFGPVVTPNRAPDGRNLDLLSDGFRSTFPRTAQTAEAVEFGAPTLRGLWAHSQRFLHDGRAHSLREVLATPNHPALAPGERGFNELDGRPDAHGATSSLTAEQLRELETYLLTL